MRASRKSGRDVTWIVVICCAVVAAVVLRIVCTGTWRALATAALLPLGVGAYLVALRLGVRDLRSADPDNSDSEEEQ